MDPQRDDHNERLPSDRQWLQRSLPDLPRLRHGCTGGHPRGRAVDGLSATPSRHIAGMHVFLATLRIAGWTRSRGTGVFTSLVAAASVLAVLAVLRQFVN